MSRPFQPGDPEYRKPWDPNAKPFRVRVVYASNAPGLHGWSDCSEVFATLDQALAVASMPMLRNTIEIQIDVAKHRDDWTLRGQWESIGKRKPREQFRFSRGWNEKRAIQVRDYLTKKGIEW